MIATGDSIVNLFVFLFISEQQNQQRLEGVCWILLLAVISSQ